MGLCDKPCKAVLSEKARKALGMVGQEEIPLWIPTSIHLSVLLQYLFPAEGM